MNPRSVSHSDSNLLATETFRSKVLIFLKRGKYFVWNKVLVKLNASEKRALLVLETHRYMATHLGGSSYESQGSQIFTYFHLKVSCFSVDSLHCSSRAPPKYVTHELQKEILIHFPTNKIYIDMWAWVCIYWQIYTYYIYIFFFSLSLSQPIMSFLIHFQAQVIPFPRLATQGKKN